MRTIVLATLTLALLTAGCATKTDGNTPGGNNSTTGGGVGNMTAKEAAKDTHDFSTGAAAGTPAGGAASKAFKMDAGYTTLNLTVTFSPGPAPAGVASGVSVKVGSLVCTLPDGPVTASVKCPPKTGPAKAGDMKIEYTGTGPVTATVVVMES